MGLVVKRSGQVSQLGLIGWFNERGYLLGLEEIVIERAQLSALVWAVRRFGFHLV